MKASLFFILLFAILAGFVVFHVTHSYLFCFLTVILGTIIFGAVVRIVLHFLKK